MAESTIKITTEVDLKKFSDSLNSLEKAFDKFSKNMKTINDKLAQDILKGITKSITVEFDEVSKASVNLLGILKVTAFSSIEDVRKLTENIGGEFKNLADVPKEIVESLKSTAIDTIEEAKIFTTDYFNHIREKMGMSAEEQKSLTQEVEQNKRDESLKTTENISVFEAALFESLVNAANGAKDHYMEAFDTIGSSFDVLGEAIVNGGDAWKTFAKMGVQAIVSILDGMAAEMLGLAAFSLIKRDFAGMGQALAGAAALKVSASVLKASAGNFAYGGIVPGNSYTGDRLLAGVNSGELILNEAQQSNVARSLMAIQSLLNGGATEGVGLTVNVINNAGDEVNVSQTTDENGRLLDIVIEKKMSEFLSSPKGGSLMNNVYGISQAGRKFT